MEKAASLTKMEEFVIYAPMVWISRFAATILYIAYLLKAKEIGGEEAFESGFQFIFPLLIIWLAGRLSELKDFTVTRWMDFGFISLPRMDRITQTTPEFFFHLFGWVWLTQPIWWPFLAAPRYLGK